MEIDEAQRLAVFQVWGVLGRFLNPLHPSGGAAENRWQDDPRCVNPLDNKAGCEAPGEDRGGNFSRNKKNTERKNV